MKVGTLFSGGEIAGEGMRAAGFEHAWGIEIDDAIAQNARDNGFPVVTADVLDVDPHTLDRVDALHASPVCTRASTANQSAKLNDEGTKESPADVAMGVKMAQFIDVLRPSIFTLENVYAYRNFVAFGKITAALERNRYVWDYDHLNSADFAVPQTRRRLILRAVHGRLLPHLPGPVAWVGWYAAIEDLIPTLPASKFAPWQLARLPAELRKCSVMIDPRAFIVQGTSTLDLRLSKEPSAVVVATVQAKAALPRAFLVSGGQGDYQDGTPFVAMRGADDPANVVTAGEYKRPSRAFLVGGQYGQPQHVENRPPQTALGHQPSFTVTSANKGDWRAWLSAGRVVSITPHALMRFQSGPDSHTLPARPSLACRIVGNGWPSLMAQRIYEGLRQ